MDKGSFLVDNGILQILRMTGEEVHSIAQSNTESEQYVCKSIYGKPDVFPCVLRCEIRDDRVLVSFLNSIPGAELLDRLRPAGFEDR